MEGNVLEDFFLLVLTAYSSSVSKELLFDFVSLTSCAYRVLVVLVACRCQVLASV